MLKNNKGFTLVELIIVIIILGVLAGVATPSVFRWVEKSRVSTLENNVAVVERVANQIYMEKGTFATAFGANAAAAETAIDGYLTNETVASLNLDVTGYDAANKQLTLQVLYANAGLDGDEFTATGFTTSAATPPVVTYLVQLDM